MGHHLPVCKRNPGVVRNRQGKICDGQPAKWAIEKWEINRTKPEEPDVSIVLVRSKKDNQTDDGDDNGRNTSASAKLKHYPQSNLYSWKIETNGDDYEVGEPVFIGKGLGLKTKVKNIILLMR